ncbi:hypothetical protein M758_1G170000 [Ceratodon purpureus]|uniref:Uncharacterized protein n=1 Tax=Ceratodon purpureus TaxID=3225 RepID=A0A8T0J831_CERPU|nr:hypothetical protein KC19_1G173400 [Ceratodon purpureus]KAG0630321.1 hypothetical protein M758_1G170000 [Ceratodon purpureus]
MCTSWSRIEQVSSRELHSRIRRSHERLKQQRWCIELVVPEGLSGNRKLALEYWANEGVGVSKEIAQCSYIMTKCRHFQTFVVKWLARLLT